MSLKAGELVKRGKELEEVRKRAFELWEGNPEISAKALRSQLAEQGYQIKYATCQTWITRWQHGKGYVRHRHQPQLKAKAMPKKEGKLEPKKELSLEQILKAVPDVETLGLLFFQGVMKRIEEKDAAYDVLKQEKLAMQQEISNLKSELEETTKERDRITELYNNKLAKTKIGTLELDRVEQALLPKK